MTFVVMVHVNVGLVSGYNDLLHTVTKDYVLSLLLLCESTVCWMNCDDHVYHKNIQADISKWYHIPEVFKTSSKVG